MDNDKIKAWLTIAVAECQTLLQYLDLQTALFKESCPQKDEINGDEYNHAMIALLNAAILSGIKIPTDGLEPLFEKAFEGEAEE